jgi:photosystem II stability/assembly factor-like uncharacterized protein
VWTLAASARDGAVVLYAGTEPAYLFESADYGESWSELPALRAVPGRGRWTYPPPPHRAHVKNVVFDPRDGRTMLLGVEQGALLRSIDGGASWEELDSFASADDSYYKDVHRIVVSPSNPRTLYLSSGDGLYGSTDGGATWEHLIPPDGPIGYPDALLLARTTTACCW